MQPPWNTDLKPTLHCWRLNASVGLGGPVVRSAYLGAVPSTRVVPCGHLGVRCRADLDKNGTHGLLYAW